MKRYTKYYQIQTAAAKDCRLSRSEKRQTLLLKLSRFRAFFVTAVAFAVAGLGPDLFAFVGNDNEQWIGTWSTALHQPSPGPPGLTNTGFNNQTLRQIVHTSVGGNQVRVQLSTFGASALVIGAAHIALRDAGAAIVPESDRTLTFGGQSS